MNNRTLVLKGVNLTKVYGGVKALDSVSIELHAGQITAVTGPNGAGKTTLLNLLAGINSPDYGSIWYKGKELKKGLPIHKIARLGISRLFQEPRIFKRLSAVDNVAVAQPYYWAEALSVSVLWPIVGGRQERALLASAKSSLGRVGLANDAERFGGQFSYGQQRLIELARLLQANACCILLDEPSTGVESNALDIITQAIIGLAKSGKAVLVIEHNLEFVEKIADTILVLNSGKIQFSGTVSMVLTEIRKPKLAP